MIQEHKPVSINSIIMLTLAFVNKGNNGSMRFQKLENIYPSKFFRRINEQETKTFEQIYFRKTGIALKDNIPSFLN